MLRVVLSEAIASANNRSPELNLHDQKKFTYYNTYKYLRKYTGMKYLH